MSSAADILRSIRTSREGGEAAWRALERLAEQMTTSGRARDDPIREVFALLGDRWTMLILLALDAGGWRQATLKRIIGALSIEGAISQRMLTLKLRALERDGFVIRTATNDVPPQVDYRLSGEGAALLKEAERLLNWIRERRKTIEAARAAFDSRDRE